VNEVTFAGLQLLSSPGRVMTPRATSEQLVDAAVAHIGDGPGRVVDVGTGSGAIAVAIADACPLAEVWATDTSRSAIRLACANVLRHGLGSRVHVRQGDLLATVPGQFDVVVANLPYLPTSAALDHPELARELFEAVFAAGDGLGRYRRLVNASTTRLVDDGVLLLQLDRRLISGRRDELPVLGAALAAPLASNVQRAALIEAIARAAA
jgi:release factor glutamine methyltransferase